MVSKLLFYLRFGKDDRYLCPFRNAVRSHYPDRTFIMECFFKDNMVNCCFSIVLLTLTRVHEHRCPPVHEHTHTRHRCPSSLLWVHDGCILHDGYTMGAFSTCFGRRWVHDGYTICAFCTMGTRCIHSRQHSYTPQVPARTRAHSCASPPYTSIQIHAAAARPYTSKPIHATDARPYASTPIHATSIHSHTNTRHRCLPFT